MSAPAAVRPEAAAGYARLRAGEPVAARGEAAVIWVEGPDAASFLHGLLTNDVAGLDDGEACAALVLDAKGHVLVELRAHRDGPDAFTLVVAADAAGALAEILERYHFSEDLEILGPEPVGVVTLVNAPAPATDEPRVPGALPGSVDLVTGDAERAIAASGAAEVPAEALEMARVAAGVPRVGVDGTATSLVQELGLEASAVSFSKGCYLGQETVARLQFRGHANRRLRGVVLEGGGAVGDAVLHDGREVGRLTSVATTPDLGPIGLAVVRREVEDGAAVDVAGAPARVVALPFGGPS
ncbi:MAG: folate-binding protein YgfZ [Thermoleophilia bacterium]